MTLDSFIQFLKEVGPLLGVLIVSFLHGEVVRAQNEKRISDLELKIKENHEKVDRDNAGRSDADIVADEFKSPKRN